MQNLTQTAKLNLKAIIALLFLLPVLVSPVIAQDLKEVYQQRAAQLEDNKKEQERLRTEIARAQSEERTLANQINYLNNQIRLTELSIGETQTQIIQTQEQLLVVGGNIEELNQKLSRLDESIEHLADVLNSRIKVSYQSLYISPLTLFLASDDFSQGILRLTYVKALLEEDKKLLSQMKDVKGDYLAQKAKLEVLKKEKEDLKFQLEDQKARLIYQQLALNEQKKAKDYLLQLTKNEEENFQNLLKNVAAEQKAIEQAINEVLRQITGRVLEGTQVTKGEIVGIQGSTGFSTGDHLHFGYYPCGDWTCPTDPSALLNDGALSWPLSSYTISQGFGLTDFARTGVYGYDESGNLKGHNGIDLFGPANSAILAVHSGKVFYAVDGWGGQGAIVRDDSGFLTIYWHLQARSL